MAEIKRAPNGPKVVPNSQLLSVTKVGRLEVASSCLKCLILISLVKRLALFT